MRSLLLSLLGAVGCAALYHPSTLQPIMFSRPVSASRSDVFDAAKRALILDGYTIQESDRAAGTVSTAARIHRLTAADADCGSTIGLPYIKDKRTTTTVAMGIIVREGSLTITPSIHGQYLPSDVS